MVAFDIRSLGWMYVRSNGLVPEPNLHERSDFRSSDPGWRTCRRPFSCPNPSRKWLLSMPVPSNGTVPEPSLLERTKVRSSDPGRKTCRKPFSCPNPSREWLLSTSVRSGGCMSAGTDPFQNLVRPDAPKFARASRGGRPAENPFLVRTHHENGCVLHQFAWADLSPLEWTHSRI